MVDAVSTISVLNTALRQGSQNAASAIPASPLPVADDDFVSSHIRVDNLQNVAILEYRSSKTGEILQQYPTQSQIDAFKRAESLESRRNQPAIAQPVAQEASSAPSAAPPVAQPAAPAVAETAERGTSVLA